LGTASSICAPAEAVHGGVVLVYTRQRTLQFPLRPYTSAQLKATFRVPSIGFTFQTDPLEASTCDFAVMGTEVNGRYYEATKG
jgi:hypothetical protein